MKPFISEKYKVILWDFDGVLMNSNQVRDLGFCQVLSGYPSDKVERLVRFHQNNGGLSRYVKFRYFFEEILGENISENDVNNWAKKFSKIMKVHLVDRALLVDETLRFVQEEYEKREMHIVSGSDEEELCYICKHLEIDRYFDSINGSPTPKKQLVKRLLEINNYLPKECVLIGDSINDLDAAKANHIDFIGYNYKNGMSSKR